MFILYLLRYSSKRLSLSLLLWTIPVLIHCKMLVLDEFIIILACVQSQLTTPDKILKVARVGPVTSWSQQTLLPPSVSEWVPVTTKLRTPDAQLESIRQEEFSLTEERISLILLRPPADGLRPSRQSEQFTLFRSNAKFIQSFLWV